MSMNYHITGMIHGRKHSQILQFVTEFWKIIHMGTREIIKIFMFSGLLIRAGYSFENISEFSCNLSY